MLTHAEEDIASNAMDLLSATSTWILVRHQWLITKMRSILTGEGAPATDHLFQFEHTFIQNLHLPPNLLQSFITLKHQLENTWQETIKSHHPLSGQTIFEQLNAYQQQAHLFMLETKKFNEQMWHDFTMRDPLTGAWTRLSLSLCLAEELYIAKRHGLPSTLALLDQDEFKTINDQWGHVTGDKVLAETAALIQKNLRPTDKLFRYGGDEWLILMPNTAVQKGEDIINRIQKIVKEHSFSNYHGDAIQSTFSYGTAQCDVLTNTFEWVAAADKRLYNLKAQAN